METVRQADFIELIKNAMPPGRSLVGELADLLNISNDSVYRRIRGETTFAFEEIVHICNKFGISFDSFVASQTGSVSFRYKLVQNSIEGFKGYIQNLCTDLSAVRQAKEKHIIYAAEDIPLFHLFAFPELACFKMFYYMKSLLNVPEFEKSKYDPELVDKEICEKGKELVADYAIVPVTEIWNDGTVDSLIKQIWFYYESGLFKSKDQALYLCHQMSELLQYIQGMAEKTTKKDGLKDNYFLYNSDVEIGNNVILVNTGTAKVLYVRHYTFNFLVTTEKNFCEETSIWLKGLIRKSTLISGVSEKQRYQFFQKAQENIERLMTRIQL